MQRDVAGKRVYRSVSSPPSVSSVYRRLPPSSALGVPSLLMFVTAAGKDRPSRGVSRLTNGQSFFLLAMRLLLASPRRGDPFPRLISRGEFLLTPSPLPPPRSYPRIRVRPENSICRIAEVPSLCPVRAVFISSLSKSKRFRSGFDWIVPRCRLIRFNSFAIPRTEYPAPVLCRLTCNGEHGTLVLTPCLHRACTVLCNNCSYTSSVYRGKVPCRARLLRRVQTARARPRVRDDIDIL